MAIAILEVRDGAAVLQPAHGGQRTVHVLRVHQCQKLAVEQLFFRPAEGLRPCRIDCRDDPVELRHQHQVGRQPPDAITVLGAFDHALLERLVERQQGFFSVSELGHVPGHTEDLLRFAILAENRADLHVPPLGGAGQGSRRARKTGVLTRSGRFDCRDGVQIALFLPEVRPGAAANRVEIADLHDPLTALTHEGQARVQVQHLDAVVDARQHTVRERFVFRLTCFSHDLQGGLVDTAEHALDQAAIAIQRRVGQRPPGLLGLAIAHDGALNIVGAAALSGQCQLGERPHGFPGIAPDRGNGLPLRLCCRDGQDLSVSVIEKQGVVRAPEQVHAVRATEHQIH